MFAYLRWARIQLAKEMLAATENSLAAIASLLGFSSQSHFQRAFREVEGRTPFLYRRRAWREQGSLFYPLGLPGGLIFSEKTRAWAGRLPRHGKRKREVDCSR